MDVSLLLVDKSPVGATVGELEVDRMRVRFKEYGTMVLRAFCDIWASGVAGGEHQRRCWWLNPVRRGRMQADDSIHLPTAANASRADCIVDDREGRRTCFSWYHS